MQSSVASWARRRSRSTCRSRPRLVAASVLLRGLVAIVALPIHAQRAGRHRTRPSPSFEGVSVDPAARSPPSACSPACGAVVEDAGASWGAIYLKDDLGTAAAVAGLAFVALQTAMTSGRLTGDRVVDRFGQRTVVRSGGVVTAVGMGFALAIPAPASTLIGFALAGARAWPTLVPAAMHTGDELPGLPAGVGPDGRERAAAGRLPRLAAARRVSRPTRSACASGYSAS